MEYGLNQIVVNPLNRLLTFKKLNRLLIEHRANRWCCNWDAAEVTEQSRLTEWTEKPIKGTTEQIFKREETAAICYSQQNNKKQNSNLTKELYEASMEDDGVVELAGVSGRATYISWCQSTTVTLYKSVKNYYSKVAHQCSIGWQR